MQAKFVLVKLCTSSSVLLYANEILSICYPRNVFHLKIRLSQGLPVDKKNQHYYGVQI